MKTISSTNARKYISSLIEEVSETGEVVAISRHKGIGALLIKFPYKYRTDLGEVTNLNAYSNSFEFLKDEPDIYSKQDVKRTYA
jgi:hypothetical protein